MANIFCRLGHPVVQDGLLVCPKEGHNEGDRYVTLEDAVALALRRGEFDWGKVIRRVSGKEPVASAVLTPPVRHQQVRFGTMINKKSYDPMLYLEGAGIWTDYAVDRPWAVFRHLKDSKDEVDKFRLFVELGHGHMYHVPDQRACGNVATGSGRSNFAAFWQDGERRNELLLCVAAFGVGRYTDHEHLDRITDVVRYGPCDKHALYALWGVPWGTPLWAINSRGYYVDFGEEAHALSCVVIHPGKRKPKRDLITLTGNPQKGDPVFEHAPGCWQVYMKIGSADSFDPDEFNDCFREPWQPNAHPKRASFGERLRKRWEIEEVEPYDQCLVMDGAPGPTFDEILSVRASVGERSLVYFARRKGTLFKMRVPLAPKEKPSPCDPFEGDPRVRRRRG